MKELEQSLIPLACPLLPISKKEQWCLILKDCLFIFQEIKKLWPLKISECRNILLRLINFSRNIELNWERVQEGDNLTHLVFLPNLNPMDHRRLGQIQSQFKDSSHKPKFISQTRPSEVLNAQMNSGINMALLGVGSTSIFQEVNLLNNVGSYVWIYYSHLPLRTTVPLC